jgi:hypothetical protein
MPNSPTPSRQGKDQVQDQVQADNLLSQPDPDTEAVAEEVSLDQQSPDARRVGQLPPEAEQAVGESLKRDQPKPH